jgi:inorganic phosphate transporter, PiT family
VTLAIILIAVGCVAYANGANDNFKGVATLFGSGTTNYRGALLWATAATFLGSMTAVSLAGTLIQNFTGKGLVDDALVSSVNYGAAVALGAGLTVLLATRIGMPISTTHSLVGALVGAGWAAGSTVNLEKLGAAFFLPLLAGPILALFATAVLYPILHAGRRLIGVTEQTCFCVGTETVEVVPLLGCTAAVERVEQLSVQLGTTVECRSRYAGRMLGFEASAVLDRLHYLSAGVVSFARGLNDTPKIAALLLLAPALSEVGSIALVGGIIAVGGLLGARRVAETMSQKITPMNHGQGFTANLLTGLVVIGASRWGLPVSTTHVSCGSLFGIGAVTGQARWGIIGKIVTAWVTTLPLGAALGAAGYCVLVRL